MNKSAILIFGAGCIGRGLFGQLASASGWRITFVEAVAEFARGLRQAGGYEVRLVGRADEFWDVTGYQVLDLRAAASDLAAAVADCAVAATAVGGAHLPEVATALASALTGRRTALPILVGENWPQADVALHYALRQCGVAEDKFVCIPVSVERMVQARPGSLELLGEALESALVDGMKLPPGTVLPDGLERVDSLAPYYARKLYTNNAGHALLAYEGHLAGQRLLWRALAEPRVRRRLESQLMVAAEMLHLDYALPQAELDDHIYNLLEFRFANRELADTVERVARGPLRKLGPKERLVGLLRRLEAHRLDIEPVCRTIAAAMRYDNPGDDEAARLQAMLVAGGPEEVLQTVCGIAPDEPAGVVCRKFFNELSG